MSSDESSGKDKIQPEIPEVFPLMVGSPALWLSLPCNEKDEKCIYKGKYTMKIPLDQFNVELGM